MDDLRLDQDPQPIDARWVGNVAVVELAGPIDAVSIRDLESPFRTLISEGASHLAIGLSEVTNMDSSGLGLLLALLKRARAAGGNVHLFGMPGSVVPLFRVTGMARVVSIFDDEACAVAAFAKE